MQDTATPSPDTITLPIRTRYSGPTDTRGSRITVSWSTYEGQRRKTWPFDYAARDAHESAIHKTFKIGDNDTLTRIMVGHWELTMARMAL